MALLLLFLLILPAFAAGNAEINVVIPSEHTITVSCGLGGKVTVGQTDYTGTKDFKVARHNDFTLTASPASDYELVSVTGDSVCEMIFDNNSVTLEKVSKDNLISVIYRAKESRNAPVGILIPITSQNNSIAAEAVITENEASIVLNKDGFEKFLESDTDPGIVSVDISNVGVDINTVVIPVSTVRTIANQSVANTDKPPGLSISTPYSEISFDSASLKSIAGQANDDTVLLNIEEIEAESLTYDQQNSITDIDDNKVIVSITLMSGDTNIHNFESGSLDIKLPYTPKANEDTETITVWYISENGLIEEIPCRYNNGYVAFTVYHLSDYLIKPGLTKTTADVDSHCFICAFIGRNINPWCWLISVFVIISISAAVLIILRKKQIAKKR